MCINSKKRKKKSTRVKSQFALKVDFVESKTQNIAWDLGDFHKLLVCHVNLLYRNLVNCQLQVQVHKCSDLAGNSMGVLHRAVTNHKFNQIFLRRMNNSNKFSPKN